LNTKELWGESVSQDSYTFDDFDEDGLLVSSPFLTQDRKIELDALAFFFSQKNTALYKSWKIWLLVALKWVPTGIQRRHMHETFLLPACER
jgi:hypothetical protein